MPFQWPETLEGGRTGIKPRWSSWCIDGLVPKVSWCCILDLSAKTCYVTWCIPAKAGCLTRWIAYPKKHSGWQWRKCRLLLLHLQTCWGFPNISYVWLPIPKYLHPSSSVGYRLGYFRARRIPQNPLPHCRSRPDVPWGLGESVLWPHQLADH